MKLSFSYQIQQLEKMLWNLKKKKKNRTILVYYVMVLRQQQQTMNENSILSKHAKTGSCSLMFFCYNNQMILVPHGSIGVLKILSEVPIFLLNEENAWLV